MQITARVMPNTGCGLGIGPCFCPPRDSRLQPYSPPLTPLQIAKLCFRLAQKLDSRLFELLKSSPACAATRQNSTKSNKSTWACFLLRYTGGRLVVMRKSAFIILLKVVDTLLLCSARRRPERPPSGFLQCRCGVNPYSDCEGDGSPHHRGRVSSTSRDRQHDPLGLRIARALGKRVQISALRHSWPVVALLAAAVVLIWPLWHPRDAGLPRAVGRVLSCRRRRERESALHFLRHRVGADPESRWRNRDPYARQDLAAPNRRQTFS